MSQQAKCNRVLPNLRCRHRNSPLEARGIVPSPNKDDNYHDADDVENVHCVFRLGYARFQYEFAALE
jgi:hypothetical protein